MPCHVQSFFTVYISTYTEVKGFLLTIASHKIHSKFKPSTYMYAVLHNKGLVWLQVHSKPLDPYMYPALYYWSFHHQVNRNQQPQPQPDHLLDNLVAGSSSGWLQCQVISWTTPRHGHLLDNLLLIKAIATISFFLTPTPKHIIPLIIPQKTSNSF